MKSGIRIFASIAALFFVLSASANAITLTGDTVTVEFWSSDPDPAGSSFGVQSVLVRPGVDGNYFGSQQFDLDFGVNGDVFSVSSTPSFSAIQLAGSTIEWRLSGLDFGTPLTSVNFLTEYNNVSVLSLGPTNVTFGYLDGNVPQGTYFQAQFVGAIPEPEIYAMMGLGLGLIGWVGRRKQLQAVA